MRIRNSCWRLRLALSLPLIGLLTAVLLPASHSLPKPTRDTAAARGLDDLLHRPYGLPVVSQADYNRLWTVWEPEWKAKVNPNVPAQIRQLTLERYGFTRSVNPDSDVPLQLVATKDGLVLNCLSCHGGAVPGTGQVLAGMPNTEIDIPTFFEDINKLNHSGLPAGLAGKTRGRTNAVLLNHVLLAMRDPDMSMAKQIHNIGVPRSFDMDAPPWWNVKQKRYLYCDALVEGDFARTMMQFALGANNGTKIRDWEPDFQDILAYIESLTPPKYPWPVNRPLARQGEQVFVQNCATCHGTYGLKGKYPERVIPIETIGTDPVRLNGIAPEFEKYYATTWFAEHAKGRASGPAGYVAPPLNGVWATAPYFHNGSVPTLYGVLTASARPKVFRRVGGADAYDRQNIGIQVETLTSADTTGLPPEARRRIIDTTAPGFSNAGHPFGFHLSEAEKRQVIEYLKTL
jgi:hypothetical protein